MASDPSPDADPPIYEAWIQGHLIECLSQHDAVIIEFADRVLAGEVKANAPQSLFVVGVLRSYGCYGAASEILELAIAGKMPNDRGMRS